MELHNPLPSYDHAKIRNNDHVINNHAKIRSNTNTSSMPPPPPPPHTSHLHHEGNRMLSEVDSHTAATRKTATPELPNPLGSC